MKSNVIRKRPGKLGIALREHFLLAYLSEGPFNAIERFRRSSYLTVIFPEFTSRRYLARFGQIYNVINGRSGDDTDTDSMIGKSGRRIKSNSPFTLSRTFFLNIIGWPSSRFQAIRGGGWPVALHHKVALSPSPIDRSPLVSSYMMSGGTEK